MKTWRKPLWLATLAVTAVSLTGGMFFHSALAATAQIYISPATTSVAVNSSFTVAVRINPGTTVTNAQAVVTYDASKVEYSSIDASSSAFDTTLGSQTGGSGSVTIRRGNLSGGVSTDSLLANITFKALAGSGSSSLGLSAAPNTDSYDTNGNSINATLTGASINFTTPVTPTCAAGQTGTYPNCVTPTPIVTGGGSSTKPAAGGSTKTPTPVTTTTTVTPPKITANTPNAQYTVASVTVGSNVPTKAYVKYGLDSGNLAISTSVSDLATTHSLQLDPQTLVPGETYYYMVVTTDAAGTVAQSSVSSFKLKGMQLKIGVFDKDHKPLKNASVTLHSTPLTAKTDNKGYVTLNDVTPGIHHLVYTSGKNTYSQEIQAANNVVTNGSMQSAPVQNFSVVYGFTQFSFAWQRYAIGLLILVVIAAAIFIFVRKQRQLAGQPVLVSDAKVVAVDTATSPSIAAPIDGVIPPSKTQDHTDQLQHIAGTPLPNPGSTITPQTDEPSERKMF